MPNDIVIGDIRPRIQYTADGMQTAFTYPFPIFADADLKVYLGEALQSGGYAVNGAGQSAGGNVTFGAAPAAGTKVTLLRALAVARTSDFQEGGAFRAKTLNDELDRQTAFIQEVGERIERALVAAPTETAAPLVLPPPAERANALLGFDAAGAPMAAAGSSGGVPISAAMAPVVQAGSLAAARGAMGVPGLTDANLQLAAPMGIGAPVIVQSGLRIGYGSVSVTGSDGDVNAGGNRAIVDLAGGYARLGAVNGGGAPLDLALLARNAVEATVGNGLALSGAADGAKGIGTINAQNYYKNGVPLSGGKLVQAVYAEHTAHANLTAVIPNDDTIPQNNEGTEIITGSITPTSASNRLRISIAGNAAGVSGNVESACALFRDSDISARGAIRMVAMSSYGETFTLLFEEIAGSTSPTTYKARFGPLVTSTVSINGDSGGRKLGGALRWVMTIDEIES